MSRLCQFVNLKPVPKNMTKAIIVTEMQKEAYEKDKINIDEYFREIFREVNVTTRNRRSMKSIEYSKFPAQTFDQIPVDMKGSIAFGSFMKS